MSEHIGKVKLAAAAGGSFVLNVLGGGDNLIILLAMLVLFDFGLGVLKSIKLKIFDSSLVRWGAVNKALEFLIIMVFYHCDKIFGTEIFRNGAIIWFCVCEGGSILENLISMGMPLPEGIKDVFAQLKVGCSVNFIKVVQRLIADYQRDTEGSRGK